MGKQIFYQEMSDDKVAAHCIGIACGVLVAYLGYQAISPKIRDGLKELEMYKQKIYGSPQKPTSITVGNASSRSSASPQGHYWASPRW